MQKQDKVFEIINQDSVNPLILTCEHASNAIPAGYENLGLPAAALAAHFLCPRFYAAVAGRRFPSVASRYFVCKTEYICR